MDKVILWDFDGVLMDSNPIRDLGFKEVLQEFPENQVKSLMDYHHQNGGLSRYVKFRYFFEEVRNEKIEEKEVQEWAFKFSEIMKDLMINPNLLNPDTIKYVKNNFNEVSMHIVSGSDQNELRYICEELDISQYFKSIHGSPTPKKELVRQVLEENGYHKDQCVLIGDSINDFEAATANSIAFIGYNNPNLKSMGQNYLNSFKDYA